MIKIYSTSWCPPCAAAKRMLNDLNQPFEEIDIEKEGMSREKLKEITGGSTVPQIIINNKSIGGFDNLVALNQTGELQKILKWNLLMIKLWPIAMIILMQILIY